MSRRLEGDRPHTEFKVRDSLSKDGNLMIYNAKQKKKAGARS